MVNELSEALRKVAVGYSLEEVTEEYGVEEGEDKLIKRKVTRKDVPPDLRAVKMLLDGDSGDVTSLSDEQLEAEKKRLLKELQNEEKEQ